MFRRDTHSPKPQKPFEPRPFNTTAIDEVLNARYISKIGTHEPYQESYFWWINPESTIPLEDIAALYQYQDGPNFTRHTPSQKSNSI